MTANVLLYCARCAQFQSHLRQGKYDYLGHLVSVVERCRVCAHESQSHEAPVTDPPLLVAPLTDLEICRCLYQRYRIRRGEIGEDV